jgi:hypothetical protein
MAPTRRIIVGVDTHSATHCAAIIDRHGRLLGCVPASIRDHSTRLGPSQPSTGRTAPARSCVTISAATGRSYWRRTGRRK